MASYSYSIKYGDWINTITINYTTSYNPISNQTTVTFSEGSWSYFGKVDWYTWATNTITVTATDNISSSGSTTMTNSNTSQTTDGGVKTFTATPYPASITVSHASGAGTKSVTIDIASKIFVNPSSVGNKQVWINGSSSTTVTSATTYSLTISQGSNTTITVKRNGSTLSNGAILVSGDSLIITFSAATGYTLNTYTVNGNTFSSGGTHSVTGNVTVESAATLNTYTLTINQGTGTTISVKKGYTALSNGATISYGDSLTISISANTEYNLGTHTVNGSNFTSGSYSVTGAVTVISTASVKSFIIEIPTISNCTFSVIRTYSPLQNANTGSLSNGNTIYYNDVISITAEASPGYGISTLQVNSTDFENGMSITVTKAVTISASVIVTTTYKLQINQIDTSGIGELITVKKDGEPIVNGADVIEGSQLTYTISIPDGYWLKTFNISGNLKYVKTNIIFTLETALNPSVDTSALQNIAIPVIKIV